MYFISRDPVRQLTNIYNLNFKKKYKKEIEDRITIFLNNIYGELTYKQLKERKNEVEINKNEIHILKEEFFEKYGARLLNFFNEEWFDYNIEYKATKTEETYFIGYILKREFENIEEKMIKIYITKSVPLIPCIDLQGFFKYSLLGKEKLKFQERKKDLKKSINIITSFLEKENIDLNRINRYLTKDEIRNILENIKQDKDEDLKEIMDFKIKKYLINISIYEMMIENINKLI